MALRAGELEKTALKGRVIVPEVDMEHILSGQIEYKVTFNGLNKIPPEIKHFDGKILTQEILQELIKYEGKEGFSLRIVLKSTRSGAHYMYSDNIRIIEMLENGPMGCFKAKISIYDPVKKQWITKKRPSTFFPLDWQPQRIKQEIISAWENKIKSIKNKWWGISNSNLIIEGYIKDGKIHGYPIWD